MFTTYPVFSTLCATDNWYYIVFFSEGAIDSGKKQQLDVVYVLFELSHIIDDSTVNRSACCISPFQFSLCS